MNLKVIKGKRNKRLFRVEQVVYIVDLDSVVPDNVPYGVLVKVGLPERFYQGQQYPDGYNWDEHDLQPDDIGWFARRAVLEVESREDLGDAVLQKVAEEHGVELRDGETVNLGEVEV